MNNRLFILLFTAVLTVFSINSATAFQLDLGKIVDIVKNSKDAVGEIDEEQEIIIGQELSEGLLGAAPLLDNPDIQQYVNLVGRWIALHSERPDLPWRFGVLDTRSINAFATPGGNIFITRGLFLMMRDEAELAGVLAHEISHVLRKHHLNAIKKNAQTGLLADLVSLKASSEGHNIDGLLDLGMTLYARGLDKDDEFDADVTGIVLSARAGYRAAGLHDVLLSLSTLHEDDGMSLMFKTHPPPQDRIDTLANHQPPLMDYWQTPGSINGDRLAEFQGKLFTASRNAQH